MSAARQFTELKFWQRARQWSKAIFHLTRQQPFASDRELISQINRSSLSVMANMAEGFGRGTQGEFVTFLGYAIGSLDETESHLFAAKDRHYIDEETFSRFYGEGIEIRKMTVAFIRSMRMHGSGVKNMGKRPSWTEEVWERYERLTGLPRPERFRPPEPDEDDDDD